MPLELWILLALGCIPHRVRRVRTQDGASALEVCALFWAVSIRQQPEGARDWTLRLPIVDQLWPLTIAALLWLRERFLPRG